MGLPTEVILWGAMFEESLRLGRCWNEVYFVGEAFRLPFCERLQRVISLRFAGGASPSPTARPFIFLLKYCHLFLQNLGSVEQSNLHRITSVGSPLWSVRYRISFHQKKNPCLLLGRPTEETIARHLKMPKHFMWRALWPVLMVGSFCASKAQKPLSPGMPKGSQPLGAAFFPRVSLQKQRNPNKKSL